MRIRLTAALLAAGAVYGQVPTVGNTDHATFRTNLNTSLQRAADIQGAYVNPTWIQSLAYSKITGVPSFLTAVPAPGASTLGGVKSGQCNTITEKLTGYDTAGDRICATDQTTSGGSGIGTLNGLTAGTQTLAVTNDANVTGSWTSTGSSHTLVLNWSGALAKVRQHALTLYSDGSYSDPSWLTLTYAGGRATGFQAALPTIVTPVCDGTTDDTTVIQNAITNYPSIYIPRGSAGSTCLISATLSVPSNRLIRVDDGVTIKRKANTLTTVAAEFLTNADYTGGNASITVQGGNWDGNAANQPTRVDNPYIGGVGFRWQNTTDVRMEGLTITSPISFGVQAIKCTRCTFRDVFLNYVTTMINQDGIHINGLSSQVAIERIRGNTNDDMVSVAADDTSWVTPIQGDISDVVVRDVSGSTAGVDASAMVTAWTTTHAVRSLSLRDIYGTPNSGYMVRFWDPNHIGVPATSTGNIQDALLENIQPAAGKKVLSAMLTSGKHITLRTVTGSGIAEFYGSGYNVVNVEDAMDMNFGSTNQDSVQVYGSIAQLNIRNLRGWAVAPATNQSTVAVSLPSSGASITNLSVVGASSEMCSALLRTVAGTTITTASFADSSCSGSAVSGRHGFDIAGRVDTLHLRNIVLTGLVDGIHLANSLGNAVRIGSAVGIKSSSLTGALLNIGSGNSVSVNSLELPVDTTTLTPIARDVTMDATGGPKYYNGSSWVALSSAGAGNAATSVVVSFSATPTFTCNSNTGTSFVLTLTGNVTSSTLASCSTGQVITMKVCQDATGGRTFTYPGNMLNTGVVDTTALVCTNQVSIFDGTNAQAVAPPFLTGLTGGAITLPGASSGSVRIAPPAAAGGGSSFTPVAGASVSVLPDAGAANNFLTGITTAGVITKGQPSSSNLSDAANIPLKNGANSFSAGAKQAVQPSSTTAGGNIACAALPSSPATGDWACDSGDSNKMKWWNGSSWQTAGSSSTGLGDPGSNSIPYRSGLGTTAPATADQLSGPQFCADAGSTDAYGCNLTPAIASYVTGTHYRFKANTANTGTASINFNSKGALTVVKVQGAITTSLADNDIRAGQWVECVYDGTNCQMVSQLGNAAAGGGGSTFSGALVYASSGPGSYSHVDSAVSDPSAATFGAEEFDTDSYHSTSSNTDRLTIPADGNYVVECKLNSGPGGSGFNEAFLALTPVATGTRARIDWSGGTAYPSLHLSNLVQLHSGDYLQCLFNPSATSSPTGSRSVWWFSIRKVQ